MNQETTKGGFTMSEEERQEFFKERAGTDDARFHVVPYDEEWAVNDYGSAASV